MNCKNCGLELRPDAKFCDACGAKVADEGEQLAGKSHLNAEQHNAKDDVLKLLENKLKKEEEKIEKKKKKKVKRKKAFKRFCVFVLVLLILAVVGLCVYVGAIFSIAENLQTSGQYREAIAKYDMNIVRYLVTDEKKLCAQRAVDSGNSKEMVSCFLYDKDLFYQVTFNENSKEVFYNYFTNSIKKNYNKEKSGYYEYDFYYYKTIFETKLKGYKNSDAYAEFLDSVDDISYSQGDKNVYVVGILEDYLKKEAVTGTFELASELLQCDDLILIFLSNKTPHYGSQLEYEEWKKDPRAQNEYNYNYFRPDSDLSYWAICNWKDSSESEEITFYSNSDGSFSVSLGIEHDNPYESGTCFYLEDSIYYTGVSETDRVANCKITILGYNKIEVENYLTGETKVFKRGLEHSTVL